MKITVYFPQEVPKKGWNVDISTRYIRRIQLDYVAISWINIKEIVNVKEKKKRRIWFRHYQSKIKPKSSTKITKAIGV